MKPFLTCIVPLMPMSIIFLLLVLFLPSAPTWTGIAILTVRPSGNNGSTVWIGISSSCARSDNHGGINCTKITKKLQPRFDFSALPPVFNEALTAETPSQEFVVSLFVTVFVSFGLWVLTCWVAVKNWSKRWRSFESFEVRWTVGLTVLCFLTGFLLVWTLQTPLKNAVTRLKIDHSGAEFQFGSAMMYGWIVYLVCFFLTLLTAVFAPKPKQDPADKSDQESLGDQGKVESPDK